MTTRRKVLQTATGGIALLAHRFVLSQSNRKVKIVGVLSITNAQRVGRLVGAFMQGMRERDWIDGQNIEYRMAFADGDMQRLDQLAAELVEQKVDVIIVGEGPAARAAQRATSSIPIVMTAVPNAVGSGLIASLAKPGGNITGLTNQYEEAIAKLVEVLHEAVPAARRLAVLVNESTPAHTAFWTGAQTACAALGMEALRVPANVPAQIESAVAEMVAKRAQSVIITGDAMHLSERVRLLEFLRPTRLAVGGPNQDYAMAGALLSFGADLAAQLRYVAKYVDKILRGARPAELPVEQPTRFELVLNLKAAKALGIAFPQSVLLRADEVIR